MNNIYVFDKDAVNSEIIKKFINENKEKCYIVSSSKEIIKNENNKIFSIVSNENSKEILESSDFKIVYNNISSLLDIANFAFYDEDKLYNFLNRTLSNDKKDDNTVIISCAGMGKRLGMEKTKCLVDIDGKTLIERHLEQFKNVDDLRIVVGYKKEEVINEVLKLNKNIIFVFNNEYMNNGTGASVCRAVPYSNKYIITIDGDLLIHPNDINKILSSNIEFAGVCKASTDNPMLTKIEGNNVVGFSRDEGLFEWTGVSRFNVEKLVPGEGHVCALLESFLPLPYLFLNTKEIDTPHDLECAKRWIRNNYSDNITIGVVGGMGSVATVDFFKRLVESFDAKKEWDRPRIIIDNRCSMPSRVRGILYNERVDEIVDSLVDSIKMLSNNNTDYIVLACNTSHYYLDEIYKKYPECKDKIVNIIELCSNKLNEKNIKEFTLLASEGTYLSKIYDKYLDKYNIKYNKVIEEEIREYIEAVKQLKITEDIKNNFIKFVNNLNDNVVLLGCTELPIIYELCKDKINKDVYDPLEFSIDYLKEKQNDENNIYKNSKVKKLV